MQTRTELKEYTPVPAWRSLNPYIAIGDIVHVTEPITAETFRFRLQNNKLKLEVTGDSNTEELIGQCLDLLENDVWSSQFVGYGYADKEELVLFAIYDLVFQVYLDAITVQKIADAYGFKKHPILYHGTVKPSGTESVAEFLLREAKGSRKRSTRENSAGWSVVVENVSRLSNYRRIIGSWTCQPAKNPVSQPSENDILSK